MKPISDSACGITFEQHEISADYGADFRLRLWGDLARADVFLVIDIYDLDNPVHPEGHVGWWRFPLETAAKSQSGHIDMGSDGYAVAIEEAASEGHWINDAPVRPARAIVNAVLRQRSTNRIVALDRVPLFARTADSGQFRARFNRDWRTPRFAAPHYLLPARATVRIVAQSVRLHDATGNLCLDLYRMLRQSEVAVAIYAEHFDLDLNDFVRPHIRLPAEATDEDIILYSYSIHDPRLDTVLNLKSRRKIAYFHGVTPPRLLQVFDPELAANCKKAFVQLPDLARFDALAANSLATAKELVLGLGEGRLSVQDIKVIPPCLASAQRPEIESKRPLGSAAARLLYVGRIKPNKRVEHLLQLFAIYRRACPDAECWIVGAATNGAYRDYLEWIERAQLEIPLGAVRWFGEVSNEQLQTIYHSASFYISMSEHEGFCLPILEAMTAGLPVAAYAQAAVQEVLGGSGVTFFDKDLVQLASHLRNALNSPDRLAEIVTRQHNRAAALQREASGEAF